MNLGEIPRVFLEGVLERINEETPESINGGIPGKILESVLMQPLKEFLERNLAKSREKSIMNFWEE